MNHFLPSPNVNRIFATRRRCFFAAVTAMLVISGTHAIGSPPHAPATSPPAYSALDDDHLKHLFHELVERVDTAQAARDLGDPSSVTDQRRFERPCALQSCDRFKASCL